MNNTRTSLFYMANLGSEVSRAISAYNKRDDTTLNASISRARSIMQKLEEFPELKGRTREIEILNNILEEKAFDENSGNLENYFVPFAMRLMHHV